MALPDDLIPSIEKSLDELSVQVTREAPGWKVHRRHAHYLTQSVFCRTFEHDKGQEGVVVTVSVRHKGTIEIDVSREESGRVLFECPEWDVNAGAPFELPLDILVKAVLSSIQASGSPT